MSIDSVKIVPVSLSDVDEMKFSFCTNNILVTVIAVNCPSFKEWAVQ